MSRFLLGVLCGLALSGLGIAMREIVADLPPHQGLHWTTCLVPDERN